MQKKAKGARKSKAQRQGKKRMRKLPAGVGAQTKVAVVTGAGRGIGRAIAEAFATKDYAVVIAEKRLSLGRQVERSLAKSGRVAIFQHTDVADEHSVAACVKAAIGRFGRIDALVNNAGVLRIGPLSTLPTADLHGMLDVNLRGPLLFSRAVLPSMLQRKCGVILSVASGLGKEGAGEYVTYCSTKHGLIGMTKALADEVEGTGVKVYAVCPGLVDTQMARVTRFPNLVKLMPEEVASLVVEIATGHHRARSGAAVDISA